MYTANQIIHEYIPKRNMMKNQTTLDSFDLNLNLKHLNSHKRTNPRTHSEKKPEHLVDTSDSLGLNLN